METLRTVLILCVTTFLFPSLGHTIEDISTFVTQQDLGFIAPVTDSEILNAFVRVNPKLPLDFTETEHGKVVLYVHDKHQDNRATIAVHPDNKYAGCVEVIFNGGPNASIVNNDLIDRMVSDAHARVNISTLKLKTDLGQLSNRRPSTIVSAFVKTNYNIMPLGLRRSITVLSMIHGKSNSKAVLIVRHDNLDYMGQIRVSFTLPERYYT